MPTTLTNGIQLPDKGSVDWYSSMQSNYNLIDTHLGDTDAHVTAEDKANWNSKQGSLSQDQLDAIAQVATNTDDIATLQSGKADASHTHSSSDITDIDDYATKDYVDNSISGLVDNAPDALNTLNELSAALNDDSNFASTVTTALAAKANSADLATVATSGSYNDLSNKPTINDSTITIQKNGSTVDTFTTNGSAKTINIPVPTKTSDLTNDSNFVDTSNSAVSSGITSAKVTDYDTHIADTDIHVTSSDKTSWNTVTSKANDSDVVHKSGDETKSGELTLSDTLNSSDIVPRSNNTYDFGSVSKLLRNLYTYHGYFRGQQQGDEYSTNARTNLTLLANRDTLDQSGCVVDTFRENTTQGTGSHILGFGMKENSVRYDGMRCRWVYDRDNVGYNFHLTPTRQGRNNSLTYNLGTSTNKWDRINGLEPSSLGMPDLSNGIDISSYIDVNQTSEYTAPADGYISICGYASNTNAILIKDKNYDFAMTSRAVTTSLGLTTFLIMLVVKNHVYEITCSLVTTLSYAKFFPCQGNV